MPEVFILDHLQPIESILLQDIFNFFTFILGSQFILPQRANNGREAFIQLKNRMRQGAPVPGTFHTRSPFLLPQRSDFVDCMCDIQYMYLLSLRHEVIIYLLSLI